MPLTTATPEVIDGISYPYLGLSMAMQPEWRATSLGAQVAVALHPFRVTEAGQIERAVRDGIPVQRSLTFGDAFAMEETDPAIAAAIIGILTAVQSYLTAKGL